MEGDGAAAGGDTGLAGSPFSQIFPFIIQNIFISRFKFVIYYCCSLIPDFTASLCWNVSVNECIDQNVSLIDARVFMTVYYCEIVCTEYTR